MIKYKRILLKLSGEALMGDAAYGISPDVLNSYAEQIKEVVAMGVQVGVVIGGGNIFRGLSGVDKGFDRVKGDQMGMLATVINSIGLQCALEGKGCKARTFTSVFMEPVGESFSKNKALSCMERGYVAIIGGGTGNPFFTTDSASALRAIELEANLLLKGTRVDGVYTADPEKDSAATKFDSITYDEAYSRGLKIMDLAAFALCKDNAMPILVFNMNRVGNLKRIVLGEAVGTLIHR
ncbi:MAG: UMP kinase [Prevotellaceae bacterium]|jgi:uridylate kinase|nr:UMP kinase [Prevotellaceae bacterium]